ncbi:hypothetical protein HPB47_014985 [Ixodes persulcatus]|uniref:Uncharacterized protein n=1 Tax=Ixodes persulcatus TaxID=34615 RepID=A0AC60QUN4_IXOPE|nr:hypothetical protein HPB47_014985 [Ixodes persulcatus]
MHVGEDAPRPRLILCAASARMLPPRSIQRCRLSMDAGSKATATLTQIIQPGATQRRTREASGYKKPPNLPTSFSPTTWTTLPDLVSNQGTGILLQTLVGQIPALKPLTGMHLGKLSRILKTTCPSYGASPVQQTQPPGSTKSRQKIQRRTNMEELHQAYLWNGKLHSDLIRVRGKTAQAKRYAKRLSRSRWFEHCASFDERTGLKKLWYTQGALWGKTKTPNIKRNIQLAAKLTAEQLEEEAANYFFPQLGLDTSGNLYAPKEAGNSGPDAPFSMQELFLALDSVNERSAPGKDGITWRMLRNLVEPEKKKLLAELNHKADRIQNLRPISLTSTLYKLLERLLLTRLTYILEESEDSPYFDVAKTGFRPGLCTQDSLYLLRNLLGKKPHGMNIVPGILVAVDLQRPSTP